MKDVPLPPAEQAEADLRKRSMATLGPQDRQGAQWIGSPLGSRSWLVSLTVHPDRTLAALTDLCEANGFNDEQIVNRNKDIKTVEMFL